MIYEIQIHKPKKTPVPYWDRVPWLSKQKVITFEPGLNIIFGINGSGKSTLINALAILMHCRDSNWPKVNKASMSRFLRPTGLADGMLLEHDGSPARYLGIDDLPFAPERGINELKVNHIKGKTPPRGTKQMSSGQAVINKLVRFLKADPKKVQYSVAPSRLEKDWRIIYDVATASLKNTRKKRGVPKQPVILLDEIDLSLDFARQAMVWRQLRELAKTHQIIAASHSAFAVGIEEANYIESTPDYLARSRKAMQRLLQDVRDTKEAS